MSGVPTLRSRAIRMLARRDYARAELARKLEPHAAPGEDMAALLDEMQRLGFLSDARFAEQLANRHRGRHGPLTVERELRRRGVADDIVGAALTDARTNEYDEAQRVLRRKFAAVPATMHDWAKQGRYLQARGFSLEVIRRLLRAPIEQDLG
ncbi:MAG: recombination regulator RecX [Betaproteobacteria bacterium]